MSYLNVVGKLKINNEITVLGVGNNTNVFNLYKELKIGGSNEWDY